MERAEKEPFLRQATTHDLDLLVTMNQQLMSDEQYDRPLELSGLKERMGRFISEKKFGTFLFMLKEEITGYAVVEFDKTPIYLRHFFIKSENRGKHLGTACFKLLLKHLKTDTIDLDVMVWNTRGYGFWRSLGFRERCISMTYLSPK